MMSRILLNSYVEGEWQCSASESNNLWAWIMNTRYVNSVVVFFNFVRNLLLPLMNSFNKTEDAVFPCRLCFLKVFTFLNLIELTTAGV